MTEPAAVDVYAIRGALLARPEVQSAEVAGIGPPLAIDFEAQTASRSWSLRLTWSPALNRLPTVFVRNMDAAFPLAHVNYRGVVCFTDNEGVAVDPTRLVDVAIESVGDALRTLEATFQKHIAGDSDELLDEWEGYWGSLPDSFPAEIHFAIGGPAREIRAHVSSASGRRRCVGFSDRVERPTPYGGRAALNSFELIRALYLPLTTSVAAPSRQRPLTPKRVAKWLEHASPGDRAIAEEFLRTLPRRVSEAHILFSQPRPGNALLAAFGVTFCGKAARHPLLDPTVAWRTAPISANRHDRAYLTRRGGGLPDLSDRRIAVVGCGAVGARVAEHLALAGVGHFILVDPDRMQADNLFRHILPGDAIPIPKSQALKVLLERRLPEMDVRSQVEQLTAWPPAWADDSVDGVVLAIGDPFVERRLSMQFHASAPPGKPLLTAWMEPFGLGGHVVLTVAGQPGCLECLYRNENGSSRTAPKTAFAEPGLGFGQNLTGCGGAFTPYSGIDATQTALLATRTLLAQLLGNGPARYASWRGEAAAFHEAGHHTSAWYDNLDEGASRQAAAEFSRCACPVCGGT